MFLNIDFFAFGTPFWELWGGSWASLGALWASKTAPKILPYIETSLFFFNLCCFCGATFVVLRFGRVWGGFWEGLGKIWGWLGMIWGRFGKVFLQCIACFFCMLRRLDLQLRKREKTTNYQNRMFFFLCSWRQFGTTNIHFRKQVAPRKRVNRKRLKFPYGCHSLRYSSLHNGPAECAKRSAAPP